MTPTQRSSWECLCDMRVTRRGFLTILVAATSAAGAAYAGALGPARTMYHWLVVPTLGQAPPGPLTSPTVKTLLAATEALIDYPLDREHYADFFRWRSENLPGHRALYGRFAAAVNQAATQSRGCDFAACEKAVRRKILEPAFHLRVASGRVDRLWVVIRERDWVLFDLHIVRPITVLFAGTDAWRAGGYEAWPGTPRGLENYVRHP